MGKTGYTGLRRLGWALIFSLRGFRAAWHHESAFRQECLLLVIAVPLALWLAEGAIERALLIGVVGLILVVELLNSGLEAAVDRTGDEDHPLAARAKDLGSAAVFAVITLAAIVWMLILWP